MPGKDNLRFGGGAEASNLHPIVLILLLVTIGLMFALPRKQVIVPFMTAMILIPFGQQVSIAGVHLFALRILILFGWIRAYKRLETPVFVDKLFLLWAGLRATATFLEFMVPQAAINQVGFLWDSVGGYFLLRFLIEDRDDVLRVVRTFTAIAAIIAANMALEQLLGVNMFGFMGGRLYPALRDGALRAQGPFAGAIPAGTFGATLFCPFVWLWLDGRSRVAAAAGILSTLVIVAASKSSTPLITLPAGILAITLWPLRAHLPILRRGITVALVGLHLSMNAPVWMLIARVSLVDGNSSYHRAKLVDEFIVHFSEWWLIGIQSTASWGWDMWDQANQFVAEGETGGLATFICFILIVGLSFRRIGLARRRSQGDRTDEWFFWLMGGTLFSYVVSFFGISFSDQTIHVWFAFLAIVACTTAVTLDKRSFAPASNPVSNVAGIDEVARESEWFGSLESKPRGWLTDK